MSISVETWAGCYDDGWHGLIHEDAFAHPAKMARGLVARIYDELFAIGALKRGSLVVDPFGGIGTTALEGAGRGVQVVCCELEPKFYALAQQNFEMHRRDWERMDYPFPIIVNGDSRKLREHIGPALAVAVISSPPYAEIASGAGGLNTKPPKHAGQQGGRSAESASQDTGQRYGESEGQLARMAHGSVDAVVSSPPFTHGYSGGGGINVKGYGPDGADKVGSRTYQGTGGERSDGNLETLTLGEVDAVVSSPPYEGSLAQDTRLRGELKAGMAAKYGRSYSDKSLRVADYGSSEGQLGADVGETFWFAAKQIVEEAYAVLRPGGVAVWVVKAFVRDRKLVDFPGDWRRLCEHVGFEPFMEVRASLVHEEVHGHLFDGEVVKRTERKSFFRRLAEKKGSPRIDWETVWFMRKPGGASDDEEQSA